MICRKIFWLLLFHFLVTPLPSAKAQSIQEQPTQVIEANPISSFSERAGLWPSAEIQNPNTENKSLTETFNETPGMQMRESGSPTLSIRGSAGADRVLKLFEGIPLNLGDGLGGSNLFIPAEAIGSIKVFKGPASAFYGSSAISGAVDHRERIFDKPAARFSLTDLGERSFFGAAPVSTEAGTGQITAMVSHNTGEFPFRSTTSPTTGTRSTNGADTNRLTAIGNFKAGALKVRPVFLIVRSVGEFPGPINTDFKSSYNYAALLSAVEVTKLLSDTQKISLRLADTRQWANFGDYSSGTESTSFVSRTLLTGDYQTDITSSLVSRTFVDTKWDQLNASYLTGGLRQSGSDIGQGLLYAVSPTLSFQPVVRYRSDSGDFIKALGFVRSDLLGRQWLTYSEGFREPSLSDRFSKTPYFVGNSSLQPERTKGIESGFSYGLDEGVNFGVTLFSTQYESLFDSAAAGGFTTTKINSGAATATGGELTAGYGFSSEHLNLAYSYLDARRVENNEPLRLAPHHQVATSFEHRTRFVITELNNTFWGAFYDREVPSNTLRELPSWSTWDLNLRANHLGTWELKAGVLNIFDVPRELTIGYPEPQRRFYVSAMHLW
jgi:outer membrane cobalamin receptor